MAAMVLMLSVSFFLALAFWLPAHRLKRALCRPFPLGFSAILSKNIPAYSRMPARLQLQLQMLVKQFLHEKKFIACDDMHLTDEVRVTIAGKACMLLLNRKPRVYPELSQILVYPSAFVAPRSEIGIGGIVTCADQNLAGESWSDGRVILAWDHVMQSAAEYSNGHNVVLHEFAHQLDSETGGTNGAPLLPSRARYQSWSTVLSQEFASLQQAARHQAEAQADYFGEYPAENETANHAANQGWGVIDLYGATNPAEFFAVVTETFFEKPAELAQFHPALYGEFRKLYRVDPRDWQ
jgi:Mlc titration factor MtfA (ptsG expression regulator)